jgi:hypothetical protein
MFIKNINKISQSIVKFEAIKKALTRKSRITKAKEKRELYLVDKTTGEKLRKPRKSAPKQCRKKTTNGSSRKSRLFDEVRKPQTNLGKKYFPAWFRKSSEPNRKDMMYLNEFIH